MSDNPFVRLAEALDRLPNRFPRTESGVEVDLLRRIFTEEEAALACRLTGTVEPAAEIAERLGLPRAETRRRLMEMVRRGLVWLGKTEGRAGFRLAPFVVGIYEAQVTNLDEEMARLFERYMAEGGAHGLLEPQPALQRVVPAEGSVKPEWVLPYDDVRALFMQAEHFGVSDCICRLERARTGDPCSYPLHNCLTFTSVKRAPQPGDISREEALAILAEARDVGLVHTVSNSREVGYVCNCCGCCCALLRGINEFGIENSVAHANYLAVVDFATCSSCRLCVKRCQVDAIQWHHDRPEVDQERCIGCGVCVTRCPTSAIQLQRKPDDQIVDPPLDFAAWEDLRNQHRDTNS